VDYLNLAEMERAALEALAPMARDYYAGGARDEITLRENLAAWDRLRLHYRVLVDVSRRDCATEVLGQPVDLPILIAPTAFHRLACDDGERATARAAAAAGTVMIVSTLSTTRIEDVAPENPGRTWFQLYVYRDREVTRALVERAEAAGCRALVLTVDAAEIGTRERDARNRFHLPDGLTVANLEGAGMEGLAAPDAGSGLSRYVRDLLDPSLSWKDVDWLASITRLPDVVKGLVRPDDAVLAVDHGARAVVVSNHGGRQLDTAPATAEVLGRVVDAVDGCAEVLVDGGVRRGTSVIKALALGARAVLVGRPALWGLAVGGQAGVEAALGLLRAELMEGMALCGTPDLKSITRDLVEGVLS